LPNKKDIKSILVIKLRNIGDVLLMSPLFSNLREHFPQARICALVNSGTDAMLTKNPCIDHIYVYDRSTKKAPLSRRITHELGLLLALRRERFDLVLNLTEGDRGALAALASGAATRIGVDALGRGFSGKNRIFSKTLAPPPANMHTVDVDLRMLEAIDLPITRKKVSFHFDDRDAAAASSRLAATGFEPKRFFLAHCTSRWMFKTMPPATAARLLDLLREATGLPCLITSSPERKELDYLAEVQRHTRSGNLPVFSDLTLKELGALIHMARFFTGVDSAPMHMAAAMDVPVLAVFGPTTVRAWGPWDNNLWENPYREGRGVLKSSRNLVLQSDRECVPCKRDGCNGSKVSDCLAFTETALVSAVDEFLALIGFRPDGDAKQPSGQRHQQEKVGT